MIMEQKNARKKHNRRTAKEINRQYICPYKNCQKVYGSEGSLNLHIKIKHNGGNKTDREKLAKTIIMAHMKGYLCQVIDQINLNLPPGTISKAAKKFGLAGQVEQQVLQQIYQRLQNKQEDAVKRLNNNNANDGSNTNNGESARPSLEPSPMMGNFGNTVGQIKKEFDDDEDSEPRRLLIEMEPPVSQRDPCPPNSIVNEIASCKPKSEKLQPTRTIV